MVTQYVRRPAVVLAMVLAVVLCLSPLCAAAVAPLVADEANLLTDAEETALQSQLYKMYIQEEFSVVVVTVEDIGNDTPADFAAAYYDSHDYTRNGSLLLISMAERDWYVLTHGDGSRLLPQRKVDRFADCFLPALRQGDYAQAFTAFASAWEDRLADANEADGNTEPSMGVLVLVSLGVGLVIAFITVSVMKGRLKSVRFQNEAGNYVRAGSMRVTQALDLFLYKQVTRTPRPQNNSSQSSGGHSHSGGGGKF